MDRDVFKIAELLNYNISLERLEFAAAREVIATFDGIKKRLPVAAFSFYLLAQARPSTTALKYLESAVRLFLAGYKGETIIMCAAALEAALRARFPNELLRKAGMRPNYRSAD